MTQNIRQRAFLILICRGLPDKVIASDMRISMKTVNWHVRQWKKRLKVAYRQELLPAALKAKLLTLEEL